MPKTENFKGNLRLRWSYRGTRHCLILGLADSARNRVIAQMKADEIETSTRLNRQ
jgi:hypothetical protein